MSDHRRSSDHSSLYMFFLSTAIHRGRCAMPCMLSHRNSHTIATAQQTCDLCAIKHGCQTLKFQRGSGHHGCMPCTELPSARGYSTGAYTAPLQDQHLLTVGHAEACIMQALCRHADCCVSSVSHLCNFRFLIAWCSTACCCQRLPSSRLGMDIVVQHSD